MNAPVIVGVICVYLVVLLNIIDIDENEKSIAKLKTEILAIKIQHNECKIEGLK